MDRDELERRCAAFSGAVLTFCSVLRGQGGGSEIAHQLQRAAAAVPANYRAARRARSRREFVAKLGVVCEEVDEAVYWLELARDAFLTAADSSMPLLNEARQLRAIFAASYATARRHYRAAESRRRQ